MTDSLPQALNYLQWLRDHAADGFNSTRALEECGAQEASLFGVPEEDLYILKFPDDSLLGAYNQGEDKPLRVDVMLPWCLDALLNEIPEDKVSTLFRRFMLSDSSLMPFHRIVDAVLLNFMWKRQLKSN